ncbi:hypothetical protein TNCV_1720561 [Trichonephila clavipes]|nr:hypothetical protein TNCV_1720561 [Trichonephila clavipes]
MKTSSVEFISRSPTPSPMEHSPLVSMEIPLRTAYGRGWPLWHAAKTNAVFARRRIEMKLLDIRAELGRKREAARENARGARAGVTF